MNFKYFYFQVDAVIIPILTGLILKPAGERENLVQWSKS